MEGLLTAFHGTYRAHIANGEVSDQDRHIHRLSVSRLTKGIVTDRGAHSAWFSICPKYEEIERGVEREAC